MNEKLLELTPERWLCPYCGEWHYWEDRSLGYYDSPRYEVFLECPETDTKGYSFYFEDGCMNLSMDKICETTGMDIETIIPISKMTEEIDGDAMVTFEVSYRSDSIVNEEECLECYIQEKCNFCKQGEERNGRYMHIQLGFQFDKEEYDSIVKPSKTSYYSEFEFANGTFTRKVESSESSHFEAEKSEETLDSKEEDKTKNSKESEKQLAKKENQEEKTTMKKENLWKQLYETSPKENVELVRAWAEKYKPTLQWALPVVTIYGAYRILNAKNSALTVENIGKEAKKKLGFSLKELNNKSALKELMVLGGLSAGAYAAIKAASAIYGKDVKELEVEQIEEGMEALDGARKRFGFIQPKTEAMFPIAVSVIIVYVMTQRPEWFEKVEEKVSQLTGNLSTRMHVYLEMVKLFAMDKLHVNLNDEKEAKKAKKFMFLAAIVGICVILYGRKVLVAKKKEEQDEEVNSRVSELVSQLVSVMKQLMPTAISGIATFLVTKKLIGEEDIVDTEFWEEKAEEEDSGEKAEDAKEDDSSEKDSEEDSKE